MSTSATSVFTGTSTFSSDFAQVVTRAQQIASLPMNQLTAENTTLTSEQGALSSLSSTFSSLQASLLALDPLVSAGNYAISYSDSTVASATASNGALLGNYSLHVIDPGSQASATSLMGVADPTTSSISTASSFRLIANGQEYDNITPASNTLSSLADAINSATQGSVQATIVNMGSTASPNYQLSLQNSNYGALPITLDDGNGGDDLLGTPTTATSVQYQVNGQPATGDPLTSDTRSLTLAPNLTVTVLAAGTTNINVYQSTSDVTNQLTAFVKAYNTAEQALDAQRGSGGPLSGQGVINTISQAMQAVSGYRSTSGSIRSLADLGITFDKTFTMVFDPSVLSAAAQKDPQSVNTFLGNSTTGGFLKAANDSLNSLTDSTTGAIPVTLLQIAGVISDNTAKITGDQDQINTLTANLNAQMAAADAAIAEMQQQAIYFANMFDAMSTDQSSLK